MPGRKGNNITVWFVHLFEDHKYRDTVSRPFTADEAAIYVRAYNDCGGCMEAVAAPQDVEIQQPLSEVHRHLRSQPGSLLGVNLRRR